MDRNEMDDKIFDFIYSMAFNDATMRKAFMRKDGQDEESFQAIKRNLKESLRGEVKSYFNMIKEGKVKGEVNTLKTIVDVCHKAKEIDTRFTFGNSQKLVNMTAKYLYIISYGNPKMAENFRYCHCPIDGTIISTLINEKRIDSKEFRDYPWSNMDLKDANAPQEYLTIQEAIISLCKGKCMPVEFDYLYH